VNYEVLGDPHLGRKFETGVPLHRRGEREQMQRQQFIDALMGAKATVHVTMGDLFDKFIVAPEVVLFAAQAYMEAASVNCNTLYVVLRGNHDVSRNTDKASSWDLFCALVDPHPNVWAISECPAALENFLFVPYDPFNYDHLKEYLSDEIDTVFSHFDIVDFGGHNVIPTKLFAEHGIGLVVNGHDHLARVERRDGVEIVITGSMQPYTHAEDVTGAYYTTVTLEELPHLDVKNKNVRVLLKPGETLPDDLDCLSLTAKRITVDDEITVDTSDFDTLDLSEMLDRTLDGLSVRASVLNFFKDIRNVA
jgi:DNA repair exonuclease SbcCD nuclease subunit